MHVGILLLVDFADLTLGMLIVHMYAFDPRWLPTRWREALHGHAAAAAAVTFRFSKARGAT
jgi:hypothetical protein